MNIATARVLLRMFPATLAGAHGREYQFVETHQLNADMHDPNNPATFTESVVQILLQPLP